MSKWTFSVFIASFLAAAALAAATAADMPLGYCDNLKGWATVSWAAPAKAGLEPPKVSLSSEQTRESKPSLKVEYAYKADGARVDNVVENYNEMPGKPSKFSVWMYGDGSGHQLDFIITDKNGQAFCITKRLDWKGEWKKLDFDFEGPKTCWGGSGEGEKGKIAYPIKRCSFDIIKGAQHPAGEGVVYLSDLRITADAGTSVADGIDPVPAAACPRTSQAPKVDGKLDDPAWKEAALISDFRTNPTKALSDPTEVLMTRDNENLYLAFRCMFKEGDTPLGEKRGRDEYKSGEDMVEFTVAPKPGQLSGWHVIINSSNSVFDERQSGAESDAKANLPGLSSATRVENGAWTCEVAIPFKDLGVPAPADGEMWGVNFCRTKRGLLADWSGKGFKTVDTGAPVTFVEEASRIQVEFPKEFAMGKNELKVSANPAGKEPLEATLAYSPEGGKVSIAKISLDGGAKTAAVMLDRRGPQFFALSVRDARGRTIYRSGLIEREIRKILTAEMAEMAYYKSDLKATLNIRLDFTGVSKAGKELRIECRNNEKVVDRWATTYLFDNYYDVTYSLAELPENHYTIDAWLRDGDKIVDTASTEFDLVKPAAQDLEPIKSVTIDENKYIRVNGKPFLPMALWWTWSQQYQLIKYHGFNTVCVTSVPYGKTDDMAREADKVSASGLYGRFNLWPLGYGQPDLDDPKNYKHLQDCFQKIKDHPSNLFYNFGDEVSPESKSAAKYAELYKKMKAERPERVSVMTTSFHYTSAQMVKSFTTYTDILLPDIYNVGRSPMSTYHSDCAFVEKNLKGHPGHTFMLVGQTNAYLPGGYRFPDAAETRLQAYLGLFGGSCGIGWYKWGAENDTNAWNKWTPPNEEPGLRDRAKLLSYFKRLNSELAHLTPVICSKTIEGKVTAAPAEKILTWCKNHEGAVYIFAANIDKTQVSAEIRHADKLKDMDSEVVYEFRKAKVKGGVIADTFKPYEVHIYKTKTEK